MAIGKEMKIRVRMFGALAASSGVGEEYLEMPERATTSVVVQAVAERYPQAAAILPRVSVEIGRASCRERV